MDYHDDLPRRHSSDLDEEVPDLIDGRLNRSGSDPEMTFSGSPSMSVVTSFANLLGGSNSPRSAFSVLTSSGGNVDDVAMEALSTVTATESSALVVGGLPSNPSMANIAELDEGSDVPLQ